MLPYITESEELLANLSAANLLIVDLGSTEEFHRGHIPGAVHMDAGLLRLGTPPAPGLLPSAENLQQVLRTAGMHNHSHVIAYDHDYNVNACRFLWTLEAVNHGSQSLLNGGMTAWIDGKLPVEVISGTPHAGTFAIEMRGEVIADKKYVVDSLNNPDVIILDARSPDEYNGLKSPSLRKGHIPGSINLNWLDTIDSDRSRRFKSHEDLMKLLKDREIYQDREIIVHCQTHQRSSHSFVMLRSLGFKNIRGYAGSWSEWGNDPSLPID